MAQSKLELIQQNRASGMSYLEAARAATKSLDVNSDANRLARLEASGQSGGRAAQNLQIKSITSDALSSIDALTSSLAGDISSVESGNPDAPISNIASGGTGAKTVQELASAVSPTAQNIGTQATRDALSANTSSPSSAINTQGNTSTIKGGGAGANGKQTNQQVIEGQTNKVLLDAVANYDANNTIDKTQFEHQKLAAEANAMETDTELKRFQFEKEQLAFEEDRIQKEKAAKDAANQQALQEKERAANEASIAVAQAKADASERELQIANDIELQKSNVAFAKLGLTLSSAAVTQAQQIYTTGVYNLSKLKSENAFKLADLQVEVAKVEFEHTAKVNDIITKSQEKSYEIRKKLNDDIHVIKNSIIDNRLERQKNIDKAVDTYQQAIKDNESEVLDKMNKANDVLTKNVEGYYDRIKVGEKFNQDKIDKYVESGMWGKLSPDARIRLEKQAGIQPGTTNTSIKGYVVSSLMKELSDIPGLTSGELSSISTEAMNLIDQGISRDMAIQMALRQNPKYLQSLVKKTKSGGGSSSSSSANVVRQRITTSDGYVYDILYDKKTQKQIGAEQVMIPQAGTSTTYDTKGGLEAAANSFLNGGGILGSVVSGISKANAGKTTTPTVNMIPAKTKETTNLLGWGAEF